MVSNREEKLELIKRIFGPGFPFVCDSKNTVSKFDLYFRDGSGRVICDVVDGEIFLGINYLGQDNIKVNLSDPLLIDKVRDYLTENYVR